MLKRLHLKNFTVFADADFEFSPGLNVLVGTNGTGKSHVLKVGYAVEAAQVEVKKDTAPLVFEGKAFVPSTQQKWTGALFYLLPSIFTTELENLVSFNGTSHIARVQINFQPLFDVSEVIDFEISSEFKNLRINGECENEREEIKFAAPVFIPAKEILTLSWLLPASEQLELYLRTEQNHLDLLNQLRRLPLRSLGAAEAIAALSEILGGELREEMDKYYLVDKSGRRIAISMVAEGLRKFGTLQKLLANGSLTKQTTLFWDEPEANLNPALLRQLAAILAELARQGFQIIMATHSTDLLKEFHILSRQKDAAPLPIKYFGLNAEPGEAVRVVSTDNFEYLPDVVALEAQLKQVDELDAIFAREDRERHADL